MKIINGEKKYINGIIMAAIVDFLSYLSSKKGKGEVFQFFEDKNLDPNMDPNWDWKDQCAKSRTVPIAKKVESLGGVSYQDLVPDEVLRNLIGKLEGFALAGYDKQGEYWFSSTYADGGVVLWLIEQMKLELLRAGNDEQ
jgi:hypothetical protein